MIEFKEVKPENRDLLWNIHQKYLYEMTTYYDDEMDESGNYHYGYFDAYFTEPERKALLIYDRQVLVGFAMINPYSYIHGQPDHVLAEFTASFLCIERNTWRQKPPRAFSATTAGDGKSNTMREENVHREASVDSGDGKKYNPRQYRYSEDETVLSFST